MKVLSIIPARGGSKGIPGKNVKHLAGLPLIAWSIEAAKESKYINRIVVSTDDSEISQVSINFGAEVINRPIELSTDTASSESALLHVLESLKEDENYIPDIIVFLQCTSPLTSSIDIDNCVQKLLDENADSATTITDFHYFLWRINSKNEPEGINHDKFIRPRRQDRESQFIETGAVYVLKVEGFLKSKHRFFGKIALSEMPAERVHEIDEGIDLLVAEVKMRQLIKERKLSFLPKTIRAVVFDFDGVMTDNKVYVNENGNESVRCDRGDGMGTSFLRKKNIKMVVLSTEKNPVVSARCDKLGIECYQDLGDSKLQSLINWSILNNIELNDIIYLGNDVNDSECLKRVGCGIVPSDAHESIKCLANIVLEKKGGEGAVRELCDLILNSSNLK